tara:strand:- start:12201 stop:12875 length:675 start_codon:yes stop_codon:yes gene_type:complete
MPRIVAFGCSFTYGEGLPDWSESKGLPSRFAWPAVLGMKLEYEVLNQGIPGGSNKQCAMKVLDTEFDEDDIAIFYWTFWHRDVIFRENKGKRCDLKILPSQNENFKDWTKKEKKILQFYYKNSYEPFHSFIEDIAWINHAKYHLDGLGIKNFHFTVMPIPYVERGKGLLPFWDKKIHLPKWNKVDFVQLCHRKFQVDEMPDGHPGVKTQSIMANKILKVIEKEL